MSLTYHYLHYFSFNISNIWWKINSLLTLIQSKLKVNLEYIWNIIGGLILIKPGYRLFCETKQRRSGAHGNRLFNFILTFITAVNNRRYCDSKTLIIRIVCTELFISLRGSYQELAWLMAWSSPRCHLQYHFLVCIKNNLFIIGIWPITNKEL